VAPGRPGDGRSSVVLGRVGAPFGVQGWVKVQSYTVPPEGIVGYESWQLATPRTAGRRKVLEWKRTGAGYAVRLEGVETREDAQALTGAEVRVDRSELPATAPGEYYWHDLIGLEAFSASGDPLGRVADILDLPAHPVVVLEGERQRLVPLVPQRLLRVELEAGRLTLDWHPDD
jgi:16S rRNA processing protein RimM